MPFANFILRVSITIFLARFVLLTDVHAAVDRPNIVIYMTDDLGWGSTNPYGADSQLVQTPHINRLAESGLRFDNASTTASVCSPTRYAMLTGRYSWRTSLKFGVVNPFDPLLIDPARETLASWLQRKGYETAQFGKWHLGYKAETFDNLLGEISPGPNDVGFDYHFGVPNNMDDLHKVYIENKHIYGLRSNRISAYGKSFYGKPYFGYDAPQRNEPGVMAELTQRASTWIETRVSEDPFLLYFAAVAVHHPIMPSTENLGSSKAGAYGDFIHDVDDSVGAIVAALERSGQLENTIIIFTSDNGGDVPGGGGHAANQPENQAIRAGLQLNGNWRGDKHQIYEGGFRVPLIISYPRRVRSGERTHALVSTIDLFATLADMLDDESLPVGVAPDSFSFHDVLVGASVDSQRPHLVLRDVHGRQAIRFGDWKLIDSRVPRGSKTVQLELYNLAQDPAEQRDLSQQYPEVVDRGATLLEQIRQASASRDFVSE